MSTKPVAIVLHRRDLRVEDNTVLRTAVAEGYAVLPLFILDPRQVEEHPYRSGSALAFMAESLAELASSYERLGGRLHILRGNPADTLAASIRESGASAVLYAKDYTPFAVARDREIEATARELGATPRGIDDALLAAPGSVLKEDGTPYVVYTPFARAAARVPVAPPAPLPSGIQFVRLLRENEPLAPLASLGAQNRALRGGRAEGLSLIARLARMRGYAEGRDYPSRDTSSRLSAHHKFGTVSVRETYSAAATMDDGAKFISELYWRDFFTHVAHHFPRVFDGPFDRRFENLEWDPAGERFALWQQGKTGVPIVDAGMRELLATGYMHNRVRMLAASFLVKDLHISWQEGERHFARHLTDYDPAVNNGSWQWVAGTGCDAAPYFRIFNPWLQGEKFDPDAAYIKQHLPELAGVPARAIHKGFEEPIPGYPAPLVDHAAEAAETKRRYGRHTS